ncbi:MAG: amino acid carrier protein [Proteobacteria bacterium]|nr:amino acid carrier protein [Pseudomonadota bacterium]
MFSELMDFLKESLSLFVTVPAIIVAGLYFTVTLKGIQFTHVKKALALITPEKKEGGISSFGAVAAVLGGNLGTGNVAGVAVALTMGGPGALLWMWVMAFLTASIKYAECYLGVTYRTQNDQKEYVGGPMYYLRHANFPLLAKGFALFTVFAALTGGTLVQVNSLSLPLEQAGYNPLYMGVFMAVLVAITVLGGMKRFVLVVSAVVPLMAVGYIGACLYVIGAHFHQLPDAFSLIFRSAMGIEPAIGGFAGCAAFQAMRTGFDRALFATESGLGLASIMHAPVTSPSERYPNNVAQGIISIFSPFIVVIVTSLTGLVLLVTNVWQDPSLISTNQCTQAFCVGFNWEGAGYIVLISLFFFAFTTTLAWAFCADRAVEFLFGSKGVRPFQWLLIMVVPLGAVLSVSFVWWLMDICLNIMLFLNLIGLFVMRKEILENAKKYLWKKA